MSNDMVEILSDASSDNPNSDLPDINTNENIWETDNPNTKVACDTDSSKNQSEDKHAIREKTKIYKPGECMKHMVIDIHPVLLDAWYCADVVREVTARGARVKPSPTLFDPALVLFSITVDPRLTSVDSMVQLSATNSYCGSCLYVVTADEVAEYVQSKSLSKHIQTIGSLSDCTVTLLIFGVKDYFKKSGRKTANSSRKLMTEIELEMAITDLLVSSRCDTVVVNTPNELALTIAQTAKAAAEAPYKKAKRELDEKAEFYMRGDNKKCVTVDSKGNGVSNLWQQMVAVLPLSSLETARSICAEYRTPRDLFETLQQSEGVSRVAGVGVCRGGWRGSARAGWGPSSPGNCTHSSPPPTETPS